MKEKFLEQNVSFWNQPLLSYYKCGYEGGYVYCLSCEYEDVYYYTFPTLPIVIPIDDPFVCCCSWWWFFYTSNEHNLDL